MSQKYKLISITNDEHWHEVRRGGLGGSDAATVLGLNPWKSPYSLWLEKTGRTPAEVGQSDAMYWGTVLESVIADHFKEQHPEYRVMDRKQTLQSIEHPFMIANIDRQLTNKETGEVGILEIKTTGERSKDKWEESVPLNYRLQVLHYLAVTGFKFAIVAVLIGGRDYREYTIEYDSEDITSLIDAEKKFWNEYITADVEPRVTNSQADTDALFDRYKDTSGEEIFNNDMNPQIIERMAIDRKIKELTEQKKQLDNDIKQAMGNAKTLHTDTCKVTWLRTNKKTFNKKRLEADNPVLVQEYTEVKLTDGGLRFSEN